MEHLQKLGKSAAQHIDCLVIARWRTGQLAVGLGGGRGVSGGEFCILVQSWHPKDLVAAVASFRRKLDGIEFLAGRVISRGMQIDE